MGYRCNQVLFYLIVSELTKINCESLFLWVYFAIGHFVSFTVHDFFLIILCKVQQGGCYAAVSSEEWKLILVLFPRNVSTLLVDIKDNHDFMGTKQKVMHLLEGIDCNGVISVFYSENRFQK